MRGILDRHKRERETSSSAASAAAADLRGQIFLVGSHSVRVERKLAEGGFAIVYIVRCNAEPQRRYALKRQFTNDPRQLAACKREIEIIKTLKHPHIVRYVDSAVIRKSEDVYETMLLTHFYRHSVLELMNSRLVNGRWLRTREEILAIFCDVCEAVARLHHSQTPVIHRDLKVENILIAEDGSFVLCDFGSATTKVLRAGGGSGRAEVASVEEEILRFTTLSYRSPEMVDLYAGQAITTAADVWALGVLLFKLAYFSLPFGESALAIQNASFVFPPDPPREPELKALIKYLLQPDPRLRPDIYQAAAVAFALCGRPLRIPNLRNAPVPTIQDLLQDPHKPSPTGAQPAPSPSEQQHPHPTTPSQPSAAERLVETEPGVQALSGVTTTTVAPRLRPKASKSSVPTTPQLLPLGPPKALPPNPPPSSTSEPEIAEMQGGGGGVAPSASLHEMASPSELGFADLEDPSSTSASTALSPDEAMSGLQISASAPHLPPAVLSAQQRGTIPAQSSRFILGHRRNVSDTSASAFSHGQNSAFRPYRSSQPDGLDGVGESGCGGSEAGDCTDGRIGGVGGGGVMSGAPPPSQDSDFNPFAAAPGRFQRSEVDDDAFGQVFDALPRRRGSISSTSNVKSSESLVMAEADPFGAAPFNPRPLITQQSSAAKSGTRKNFLPSEDGVPSSSSAEEEEMEEMALDVDVGDAAPLAQSSSSSHAQALESSHNNATHPSALRSLASSIKSKRYRQLIDDEEAGEVGRRPSTASSSNQHHLAPPPTDEDADSVGSASDLRLRMAAESSEDEEEEEVESQVSQEAEEELPETSRHLPYDQLSSEGGLSDDCGRLHPEREKEIETNSSEGEDAVDGAGIGVRPLLEDEDDDEEDERLFTTMPTSESTATIKAPDELVGAEAETSAAAVVSSSSVLVPPRMPADPFMSAPLPRAGSRTPTLDEPRFSLPACNQEDATPTAPPRTSSMAAPALPPLPPHEPLHHPQPPPQQPPHPPPSHSHSQRSEDLPRLPPPLVQAKPSLPLRSPLSPSTSTATPLKPPPVKPLATPSPGSATRAPLVPAKNGPEDSSDEDVYSVGSAGSKVKGRFKKAKTAKAGEDEMVLTAKQKPKERKKKEKKEIHASNASLASKHSKRSKKSTKSGELSFVNSSFQASEDWEARTSESDASEIH